MDDLDSVDGLGVVFNDLSAKGKQRLLYRAMRAQLLSPTERAAIAGSLDRAKSSFDQSQAALRDAITPKEKRK